MPRTVTVGGFTYTIGHMNTFGQLHVARKLQLFLDFLSSSEVPAEEISDLTFAQTFLPVVSMMPTGDFEDVVTRCLRVVQRKIEPGTGWANVIDPGSGQWMFQDIGPQETLALVWNVLKEHRMPDFLRPPPKDPSAAAGNSAPASGS